MEKNNTKEREMLFIWAFNWFSRDDVYKKEDKVELNYKKVKQNFYVQYLIELIKAKVIDKAYFVYIDTKTHNATKEISPGITITTYSSFKDCLKGIKKHYKYIFIRGDFSEFNQIIENTTSDVRMFYAADYQFMPDWVKADTLDIIYIDNFHQIKIGKKKYPDKEWVILKKTVDSSTFYTKKNTKKKYDICYPANFYPWKNHELLFTSISKLKNSKDLICICPGKTFDKNEEIGVWAAKNNANVHIPGVKQLDEVAKIMRQSKIGVIPNEKEANPRILTEMMACGLPLVANKNLTSGLNNVNRKVGIISSLDNFPKNIAKLLKKYKKYHPEKYFQKHLTPQKATEESFIKPIKKILKKKNL